MTIEDEKVIWHEAHDIATREIERIRNGKWGGGHEPHPGLAAAIANFAIGKVAAEREACEWIIRANVEGSKGGQKSLFPRGDDDLAGLAYADAIANRSK